VVAGNLRRVAGAFAGSPSAPVAVMRQVHGAEVVEVRDAPPAGAVAQRPECDALVTRAEEVTLLVRAADCVPVLLADPDTGVVAAVHAGRTGVARGVVPAAIRAMRDLGAGRVRAWVGPHVCGRCYEVPAALRDQVAAAVPATRAQTSWGTPALDLGAGVGAQLTQAGLGAADVVTVARCTREDLDLYSHRRDGAGSGRLGGLVRVVAR
jgi:purine-nucleoside/S-methyl-5'-thioadenosine phosphorylase / adenosine deaminase